jgi:CheY-like chemotaxis protein
MAAARGSVLIVDDDRAIASLVADVLEEEGFAVVELADTRPAAIHQEVARLEPDVVLLDGGDRAGSGESWAQGAWLHERTRPIAVIMFTSHIRDLQQAQRGESECSQRASFVGVLPKPFDLHDLIVAVRRAVEEPSVVLSHA